MHQRHLDIKNPNTIDAAHGDPAQMLAAYQNHLRDISELRATLKAELENALAG